MIFRCPFHSSFLPILLLSLSLWVRATNAQDTCHPTVDGIQYDLTSLAGEHTISRTRDTPPSTMVDSVRFDLCGALKPQDGVAEVDQCPPDTVACLTKINRKGSESERIVAVVPLAQTPYLSPEFARLSSPKGLSIILHGPSYPSPSESIPQSLNMTLLCSLDSSDAKFISYNGSQLSVEWSAPAGCRYEAGEPPKNDEDTNPPSDGEKEQRSVGSGIGWFFLALLLSFAAYFGLGAYYNYSTYGATGVDLIPHRDFWREVPYMLRDVASHLCSSVRPRHSSRGGYIAV